MLNLPNLTKKSFYYTDDELYANTGVRIAFATRNGGVGEAPYDTLNLGSHVGDDDDVVIRNREILMKELQALNREAQGFPQSSVSSKPQRADCENRLEGPARGNLIHLYNPSQVHGDNVIVIEDEAKVPATAEADGVLCRCANVAPLLCFADCTPVILVSETGDFAVVHCGWRGVVKKIAVKAYNMLEGDVNVYIGAHIRQCCFEVGPEVALQFDWSSVEEMPVEVPQSALRDGLRPPQGPIATKPHVDMANELKLQLTREGLSEDRICELGICTKCHQDEFFSYRGSGGKCGRHGAIAFREK